MHKLNRAVLLACVSLSIVLPAFVLTRVSYREIGDANSYREAVIEKRASLERQKNEYTKALDVSDVPKLIAMTQKSKSLSDEMYGFEETLEEAYLVRSGLHVPEKSKIIISVLFCIGAIVLLTRLLISAISLFHIIKKGHKTDCPGGGVLIVSSKGVRPASWFNYIFIDEEDYLKLDRDDMRIVLMHEKAHCRLLHSADLLFVDIVTILQWYNPAIWMLRQDLSAVHEYEADKTVLDSGVSPRDYQYLLVRKTLADIGYSLANCLTAPSLKSRIAMMSRRDANPFSPLKAVYLVAVVVLGLFYGAKVDSRIVLDINSDLSGFYWSDAELSPEDFLQAKAEDHFSSDIVVDVLNVEKSVQASEGLIVRPFLAGEKVCINVGGHKLSCRGGGLVSVNTSSKGSLSVVNSILRPQLSLDEHFYIAFKDRHSSHNGELIELSRQGFEKELCRGVNRKVILIISKATRERRLVIYD